jgi:hypothetical protein
MASSSSGGAVTIACRIRPPIARADGADAVAEPALVWSPSARTVRPHDLLALGGLPGALGGLPGGGAGAVGPGPTPVFGPFDALFTPESPQAAVYEAVGAPAVRAALEGINATILA